MVDESTRYPQQRLGTGARRPGAVSVNWPLTVYFLLVIVLVMLLLALSYVLGERHREPATGAPYESGILPAGPAQVRFSPQFYLVAAFFVVFDLEAVFLFAWAVSGRALGWSAYIEVVVFVSVLLAALVYLWRAGGLDLGPRQVERGRRGRTP